MTLLRAKNEAETRAIAARLARTLAAALAAGKLHHVVVGLSGPLGAGKTAFVRGFVAGLDPARALDVSSPTYALIHVYPGVPEVRHVDLYRLERPEETRGLGLHELVEEPGLTLIEWIERAPGLRSQLTIRLAELRKNVREIQLEADPALGELLRELEP